MYLIVNGQRKHESIEYIAWLPGVKLIGWTIDFSEATVFVSGSNFYVYSELNAVQKPKLQRNN
jgi:hypothetical protein